MDLVEFLSKGEYPGNYGKCKVDIKLRSPGLFALPQNEGGGGFLVYALPRLQLQLALIFLLTQSLHLLLRRINFPRIVSEILVGIILGKSMFGHVAPELQNVVFPEQDLLLDVLAKVGFIYFMFLVGVKMDPSMAWKTGRKCISIGLAASIPTLIITIFVTDKLNLYLAIYRIPTVSSVMGIVSITSFPVVCGLLIDLKIMNSELGRLCLASTLISDLIGTTSALWNQVFTINAAVLKKILGVQSATQSVLIILFVIFGMRPLFFKIIKRTPEGKPVRQIYIAFICWTVIMTAILCDQIGLQYHFVPFVLGLVIPDGPPLGSTLADKLDTIISGLLAPLMVTNCALKIDVATFYDFHFLRTLCFIMLLTVIAKFGLILGSALLNKVPIRDAVTVGIIMGVQGIVHGAYYDTIYRNQSIDAEIFTLVIMWIAATATFTHLSVELLYDHSRTYRGYEKRTILHTPYNSELRILACVHRVDDALAAIKLLEASGPSREGPIGAYALHLVELVGRATPLIINHKLGQKNSSGGSYSQQMIDTFQNLEQVYSGLVTVQVFTSMSLPRFMHEDICSIAFDKSTSLILLPFHRKWNQQGKIIFDSNIHRTMNREVMQMAPCSVGILIDRRKILRQSSEGSLDSLHRVAVVFLGGDDDREVLAYAKRMVRSVGVQLTVVRLLAPDELTDQWDTIVDREALRDIKIQSTTRENIVYREEKVNDGTEIASIMNTLETIFDLIMVGRRHGEDSSLFSGLSDWSEVPELGALGDMLASSDVNKPVSVLVVQQQIVKKWQE